MHKPRLYIDTSAIVSLNNQFEGEYTVKLWEEIKQGYYSPCISELTLNDVMNYDDTPRLILTEYLDTIAYDIIESNENVERYVAKMQEYGVMAEEKACLHIGCAVVGCCDMIVSLDFKNTANIRTISGVRFVNSLLGYKDIGIYLPCMIARL